MGKSRKWGRCILSFVLAAGMSSASIPVYAAPLDGGSGSDESNAKLPEIQTVTSIDFQRWKIWILCPRAGRFRMVREAVNLWMKQRGKLLN